MRANKYVCDSLKQSEKPLLAGGDFKVLKQYE